MNDAAMSLADLLRDATARLASVSESPRLDAELLLARAIDTGRAYLIAHGDDIPDDRAVARFERTLAQRLTGEPMAYIEGEKEFWSMRLQVTPATLVPRPETEILVDRALREIPRRARLRILDLGTGSGAIALALARERPLCQITAVDISADALAVAKQNAQELALPHVRFCAGSWTDPVAGEVFDLVVSNPPYVAADDPALDALRAEPVTALAAGPSGAECLRELASRVPDIIADGGTLLLEHGSDQREVVADLLADRGWSAIQCYDDYAGLPRVTSAQFQHSETP